MTPLPTTTPAPTQGIETEILDLMLRAGSRWVLWLMLGLSLAAVAVMVERLWFFVRERPPRARLGAAMTALRTTGPAAALAELAGAPSMAAAVARACLTHAADGAAAVEEHRLVAVEDERRRYEQRLAFLGTLGNNAPFIGLFGTVLGIVRAFHDLAVNSAQDPKAVMAGIAASLVATGVGLLVALPAVATYNAFVRRIEVETSEADGLAHTILAYIKTPRGRATATAAGGEA